MNNFSDIQEDAIERWDGKNVLSLYPNGSYSVTKFSDLAETEHESVEFQCAMQVLDDMGVPRKEEATGEIYSIVGRIKWLENSKRIQVGCKYYYENNNMEYECVEVGHTLSKFVDTNGVEYNFYNVNVHVKNE